MTTPLRWSLGWRWGGAGGVIDDVEVTFSERAALFGGEPGVRRATVRCVLPIDAATYANRTHPRTGTAILTVNGLPVLSGFWTDFRYYPDRAQTGRTMVEITVGDAAENDVGDFPPPVLWRPSRDRTYVPPTAYATQADYEAAIDSIYALGAYSVVDARVEDYLTSESFGDVPILSDGQEWPWVYGSPGDGARTMPGSPAWCIDVPVGSPKLLLIAGHPVDVGTVSIIGPPSVGSDGLDTEAACPVLTATTPGGRTYSYVEVDPSSTWTNVADDVTKRYYVAWDDGEAQSGAAGDLLATVYAMSSRRVDVAAWLAAAPSLNRYLLAGYVDRRVSPSDFLRREVLPLLPVSEVVGPFGVRPALWPWVESGSDPRGPIVVVGAGVVADGSVEYRSLSSEVRRLSIRYGHRPDTGGFTGTAVAGYGWTAYATQARATGVERWEASAVWDQGTAQSLALLHYRYMAWAPRIRSLMVLDWDRYGPGGPAELYPGREIRLTDSACGWTERAAVVVEVESTAQARRVTVWLRDDPLTGS